MKKYKMEPALFGDFYHKYRPRAFDEVCGHDDVIRSIRKVPCLASPSQAYLFTGESGCGKTTTARILSMALNCTERSSDEHNPCRECKSCKAISEGRSPDVQEINAADTRGIDEIRRIKESMSLAPMGSKNKIFVLDECHSLTKDAQNSLLKVLEEAPKNVFIILCSTVPQKILATVKNRCQKFDFPRLSGPSLVSLLQFVSDHAGLDFEDTIGALHLVAESSENSPRAALVCMQQLHQAFHSSFQVTNRQVVDTISGYVGVEDSAINICRALVKRARWTELVNLYKDAPSGISPEAVRMSVLGFFRTCLLNAKNMGDADRYAAVMALFDVPFSYVKPENSLVLNLYRAWKALGR